MTAGKTAFYKLSGETKMKQIILVIVLSLVSVGAFATVVPHTLVGGVIVTKIPGAGTTATETIQYNVPFPSLALCQAAVAKVEMAYFSPIAALTQGLPSAGDARKLVYLQCVARAAVAQ